MFKIGDFSRLTQVPVSTLRYYAELGLLEPARTDPHSGYRYYTLDQLPRLNRVLALKDLGLSLDEIARLLGQDLPPGEYVQRAAWQLLAETAMQDSALPDSFFEPYLDEIEAYIHTRPNRARQAMNNALIALGSRSDHLERRALASAAAIGPVNVDHGETSCITPDAAAYIRKRRNRLQAKAAA